VNYIHKYYADPKTKLPHPVLRIENGLNEIKARIDPESPTEKQVLDIMKTLITVLPCKKMEMEGVIVVPFAHKQAANNVLKKILHYQR